MITAIKITPNKPTLKLSYVKRESVKRGVFGFFSSLRFVLISTVGTFTIAAAVGGWAVTYSAGQESTITAIQSYQEFAVRRAAVELENRFVMAENAVFTNQRHFSNGVLTLYQPPPVEGFMKVFFNELQELVKTTCSSVYVATVGGRLMGHFWYYSDGAPPTSGAWVWGDAEELIMEWVTDPKTGDLTKLDGVNYSAADQLSTIWYQTVDLTKSGEESGKWTSAYAWGGQNFVSFCAAIHDPNSTLLGITGVDLPLGFTDLMAKELANSSSITMHVLFIEAQMGVLVGTSIPGVKLTQGAAADQGVMPWQAENAFVKAIDVAVSLIPGLDPSFQNTSNRGGMYRQLPEEFLGMLTFEKQEFRFSTCRITRHGMNFVLLHLIDMTEINAKNVAGSKIVVVVVSVLTIVSVSVVMMSIMFAMRTVSRIVSDLDQLAVLDFAAVIEAGKFKKMSTFSETRELQEAVIYMTKQFAQVMTQGKLNKSSGGKSA